MGNFGNDPMEHQLYHRLAKMSLPRHAFYRAVPFWSNRVNGGAISRRLRQLANGDLPTSFYVHRRFFENFAISVHATNWSLVGVVPRLLRMLAVTWTVLNKS